MNNITITATQRKLAGVAIAGMMTVVLASAFVVGGCGRTTKVETRNTTTGQELQDLDVARSKGLLTESEYAKKRKEIMNRD